MWLLKLPPPEREQVNGDIINQELFSQLLPAAPQRTLPKLLPGGSLSFPMTLSQCLSMAQGASAFPQQLKALGMDLWLDFAVFGDAQSWFFPARFVAQS